jgi:hypothetical protein
VRQVGALLHHLPLRSCGAQAGTASLVDWRPRGGHQATEARRARHRSGVRSGCGHAGGRQRGFAVSRHWPLSGPRPIYNAPALSPRTDTGVQFQRPLLDGSARC